ncbi:cation diffusion facilitator family transporter [Breznakiella homolactica]|uniref:Cation transporter n=1 Tax=Breznakiella homolactica TaxID=2798577 RepID=A0A7T8BAN4_9SPIR|nr:cation diffusion facilitator family transporter [Breznakiella homolactica]QQO09546.1 cation diffusion facilitator family transporter [Breznakiella homolactica]
MADSADKTTSRAGIIRTAALTALIGNTILAVLKIVVGLSSGSLAVVGDGIDSSIDVLIALMSLLVARIIARPADAGHPWGHGRAETIATVVLSFILFFAGGQLILNAVSSIASGEVPEVPSMPAVVVTVISIAGKLLLAYSQFAFGKKANSAMLKANAKNMASDVIISAGVLVGLGISMLTGIGIIDPIVAILVGFWVIKSAVGIFTEANAELMDGGSGTEPYREVFDAVRTVPGAGNPHRARMRRIAGFWDIDIDIEVNPDLTVREAHGIATKVEDAIKARIEGVYDIMVHVEPAGDSTNSTEEGFGLCEDELRKDGN